MKSKGCSMSTVGYYLVLIGAVNWGLVGLGYFLNGNWNVVHMLLGMWPVVESLVYVAVGAAGVMLTIGCKCARCRADSGMQK